jgi:hypothetical protein
VFGLFDRLGGKSRKAKRARKKELAGRLDDAAALYLDAELLDDAARVLLLKADTDTDPERRMVLCAQAARVGGASEHGDKARRRKARLGFDLAKSMRGATMHGELLTIAAELEAVGEWQAAAEAFALAGDSDGEIRVLKDAGAIEQLEERLRQTTENARRKRDLAQLLRRIGDLDTIAERREALRAARAWLAREHDDQVQLEADRIAGRLLEGPSIELELDGQRSRYVLGSQITLGRARADILVHASAVSRQHLRLYRKDGEPYVEDLETRNGTSLAGARVEGSLPVGTGLELELADQLPCRITPRSSSPDAPLLIDVAGDRYVVPLGPLAVLHWKLVDAHDGDDRFVVLRTSEGQEPPHMGGYRLGFQIELCHGDRIRRSRDGEVVLAVPAGGES